MITRFTVISLALFVSLQSVMVCGLKLFMSDSKTPFNALLARGQRIGADLTRLNYNVNQFLGFAVKFPILLNHRTAKFKEINRNAIPIPAEDTKDSIFTDYVKKDEIDRVIDHAYYGRMIRAVYDLLKSDPQSGQYGESLLSDDVTKQFIGKVFDDYEVIDILKTTVDTPNQKDTTTGKFLSSRTILKKGLFYDEGKGNFMGFIAYNKLKKDLAIIFRGTVVLQEWIQDIEGLGSEWNSADVSGVTINNLKGKAYGQDQFSLALYESTENNPAIAIVAAGILGFLTFLSIFIQSTFDLEPLKNVYGSLESILEPVLDFIPEALQGGLEQLKSSIQIFSAVIVANPEIISQIGGKIQSATSNPLIVPIVWALLKSIFGGGLVNFTLFLTQSLLTGLFAYVDPNYKRVKTFQTGFSELYTTPCRVDRSGDASKVSPKQMIYKTVQKVLKENSDIETITVSGHSLGASLAVIAAHHAAEVVRDATGSNKIPVNCVTFACPRVGSPQVFKSFKDLNIHHYHYLNRGDIVPIVMPGIFTNGLGYPNNYVLRMDPESLAGPDSNEGGRKETDIANVPKYIFPYTLNSFAFLSVVEGWILTSLWSVKSLGLWILSPLINCFIDESEPTGVIMEKRLNKIGWPISGALLKLISVIKTPFDFLFKLFGLQEDGELFLKSARDWHNLENIIYNMLVEAHHAESDLEKKKKLIPDLALLNAESDRISKNIQELRKLEFVGPNFQPVRGSWFKYYINAIEERSPVIRNENKVLSELTIIDLAKGTELYKSIYINADIYKNRPFLNYKVPQ